MTLKNAGLRFKEIRKKKKMTQTEFAELLGTTQRNISKYENEKLEIPDKIKAELIKIGVDINWLLTGEGEMFLKKEPVKSEISEALSSRPSIKNIILMPGQTDNEDIKNIEGMSEERLKMRELEKQVIELKKVAGE